eukprot:GSChrysophyteH1.ASY1.ANO1.2869.1 assembled CDS
MSNSGQVRKSTLRERQNYYIHSCFIRNNYRECLKTIEEQLHQCNGQSEYPLYIKGLIMREQGRIEESLMIFQAALCLNPVNINNLKQKVSTEDRMVWHSKGICFRFLKQFSNAIECFETANSIQKHESTFHELGETYKEMEEYDNALNVYMDALDAFPESSRFLTTMGLFILAAGSIIQASGDYDVALTKYRVAMVHSPHCAELWNNIGLCFFGKAKLIGANASAFHYLSTAINLQKVPNTNPTKEDARCYTYLGVALSRLEDYGNAFAAYEKAIELKGNDPVTRLNYALGLAKNNENERSEAQLQAYENICKTADGAALKDEDAELDEQFALLKDYLKTSKAVES